MKNFRVVVALVAGAVVLSPNLHAQAPAKPSPYSGVSQPPPDDTITTDDAAPPSAVPPAKLIARPADAPGAMPAPAATPAEPSVPAQGWNSDYGMIGDPPGGVTVADLAKRPLVPAAESSMAAVAAVSRGDLPEGTVIRMILDERLATGESQPGSDFTGRVATDVLYSGSVVIPQGSAVVGKVLRVTAGRRFGSPATIRLRPDVVVLPDGTRYVMRAQITDTAGESRIDGEGALKPKSRMKTNAIKEGAGIGTGAVAGAIIGGAPGALVGSLIGAGVMTTNILVQHPAMVTVPKNTILSLSLTEPMSITPTQSSN